MSCGATCCERQEVLLLIRGVYTGAIVARLTPATIWYIRVYSATSTADWSNEKKNVNFIEDYRSFTCLWQANSDNLKDNVQRSDALLFLKAEYNLGTSNAIHYKIKCFGSYFRQVQTQGLPGQEEERFWRCRCSTAVLDSLRSDKM